jgi:hypothetical protein
VETVDWVPTSSVSVFPTSYLATSYVMPTSYLATSYVTPTSYVAPTSLVVPSYYETRFRRSLFGRRLIPSLIGRYRVGTPAAVYAPTAYYSPTSYFPTTLYYPTAYYAPTTYATTTYIDRAVVPTEYEVVRESSACCDDSASVALVAPRVIAAPERSSEPAPRRRPAPTVRSEAGDAYDDAPELPSNVEPESAPPARPRAVPNNEGVRQPAPAPAAPEKATSPPNPQTPERKQSTARPNGDASKEAVMPEPAPLDSVTPAPPEAPSGTEDLLKEPASDQYESRTESRKPVYASTRAYRPESRNVLFGRVRERETREPEEGVRVLLSNRTRTFDDRIAMTDAFGRFAVRVPDGDWTVKVTMPSGQVYSVSEITVSNGEISDDQGRDVPSLTITR